MNANNNPRLRAALRIAFAGLILLRANGAPAADIHRLASPDGRIVVLIEMPAPNSTARPRWSAAFHGKPVLAGCELGLQTSNAGEMMAGARVRRERSRSISRLVPVLFGKSDRAYDCFRETRFSLETLGRRRLDVVFRAYDDAVALRYELPKDDDAGSVTVTDETTSFVMAGEPEAYAQYLESYATSHEHNVTTSAYGDIRPDTLMDMPLTFSWDDGTCAAITEASLRHYAGMSLMRCSGGASTPRLVCKLTPRPDGSKVK